ncbi:MAG: thymidine phosphorylase [Candidatus Coatesbacteria bacterium]|nr:MAG: thymidine phosphorylase [Candidatus Coatesbacteria bacterium]
MWFKDLIRSKRDGATLPPPQWRRFVAAVTAGELPDYQVAAFLMAIYFRGMTEEETAALTEALADSGDRLTLGAGPYVDKHSTGGVGDKVTLVAVPWAAACGARVVKLSGRGLGHTGGTIDKLAAIPDLDVSLSGERLRQLADAVGWAVGEAGALAPADKILYALRDATSTVEALPLIVASILSKKLAAGAPALVFDVKAGRGAFAGDEASARELATALVRTAHLAGRRAVAVVTAMDEPLGYAVGNALEVAEAAAALRGEGPADVLGLSRAVAAEMVILAGVVEREAAEEVLDRTFASGEAFGKLEAMARAQGAPADWLRRLPQAERREEVRAGEEGYVTAIDALAVARAANILGAGRMTKEDAVDPAAGVTLHRKTGARVEAGDVLMTLHYDDERGLEEAQAYAAAAFTLGPRPAPRPLVLDVIREDALTGPAR